MNPLVTTGALSKLPPKRNHFVIEVNETEGKEVKDKNIVIEI